LNTSKQNQRPKTHRLPLPFSYIQNLKKTSTNKFSAAYKTNNTNQNDEELILKRALSDSELASKDGPKPSLFLCLFKVFGGKFLAGSILKLVADVLSYAGPVLLHLIINFINDSEQILSVGLFLTALLFAATLVQSLLVQHYYIRMYLVGQRMRTALILLVYKKVNGKKFCGVPNFTFDMFVRMTVCDIDIN
jgi:hypothetical protein